jgi:molecular chaperone GrpE (heat shock protein)
MANPIMVEKRTYTRRSDAERIAELQTKIDQLQNRLVKQQRADMPVIRDIPKVQRRLRRFVQLAMDHGRQDLAHSTMAFVAGLDRVLSGEETSRRRGRDQGGE